MCCAVSGGYAAAFGVLLIHTSQRPENGPYQPLMFMWQDQLISKYQPVTRELWVRPAAILTCTCPLNLALNKTECEVLQRSRLCMLSTPAWHLSSMRWMCSCSSCKILKLSQTISIMTFGRQSVCIPQRYAKHLVVLQASIALHCLLVHSRPQNVLWTPCLDPFEACHQRTAAFQQNGLVVSTKMVTDPVLHACKLHMFSPLSASADSVVSLGK